MNIREYSCCNPFYWQHPDGWDVYRLDECEEIIARDVHNRHPRLRTFPITPGENAIVEDAPSLSAARLAVRRLHTTVAGFRICLAPVRVDADH